MVRYLAIALTAALTGCAGLSLPFSKPAVPKAPIILPCPAILPDRAPVGWTVPPQLPDVIEGITAALPLCAAELLRCQGRDRVITDSWGECSR